MPSVNNLRFYFMRINLLLSGITVLFVQNTVSAEVPEPVQAPDSLSMSLSESVVTTEIISPRRSALRLTTISGDGIRDRAHSRTFPEMFRYVPGIYATSESGSYGDAKLNIRGFTQENLSIMLNGIPISGLTTGNMFWNNWMGLSDATSAIQILKGTGASMLSDSSVGGSVNIITKSPSERMNFSAGTYISHFGTARAALSYDSGQLAGGWSLSLNASYTGGKGYVDATDVNSYAYLLSIRKSFRKGHVLEFTALGSPEHHQQRSTKLSSGEVSRYGLKYNRNWGWRDGEMYTISENNYFKPYFTLQHRFSSGKWEMKNSVYFSIGDGGGRWTETKDSPISSCIGEDGQIDWDYVIGTNMSQEEVPGYGRQSLRIMSDYRAGHTQTGAIVSAGYRISDRWKIGAGAHYQYYSTWEYEVIDDLLGGDFWFEDYENSSLAGTAGRNPYKTVGDLIRTNNGKTINHGTGYLSAEYDSERLHFNAGAAVFTAGCKRWDRYNYTGSDIWSGLASGTGASLKAGLLYRISQAHNIYINGGAYSRLPYSDSWFSSGNNSITLGVRNEKDFIGEAGYRFVYGKGGAEANIYAAYRMDKSLMSDPYIRPDEEETRYMINGLDALHYGIEAEAFHNFTRWLRLSAYVSVGDWRWKNDVVASIYDEYTGQEVQKVAVYCRDLPVGDAPQTQVGAILSVRAPYGFRIQADWQFNDRMYADFDPAGRTDPDDRAYPYRIPSWHSVNAMITWEHTFAERFGLRLFISGSNLLNATYIERGKDGAGHDLESFRGFWAFGRNFTFGATFSILGRDSR